MGRQNPILRICHPLTCWHKHTKIGVFCASLGGGDKCLILGTGRPYFGGGPVFCYIIRASVICIPKIPKKLNSRQFSASRNSANFWQKISGHRKLARVRFFCNFWATSGNCRFSLGAYLPGPEMPREKFKNCDQYNKNKVCEHLLICDQILWFQ